LCHRDHRLIRRELASVVRGCGLWLPLAAEIKHPAAELVLDCANARADAQTSTPKSTQAARRCRRRARVCATYDGTREAVEDAEFRAAPSRPEYGPAHADGLGSQLGAKSGLSAVSELSGTL
jgi:hypothetical protein